MALGRTKSLPIETDSLDSVGRSYYIFCIEQALMNVRQARAIVADDQVDADHELPDIQRLLEEALEAS